MKFLKEFGIGIVFAICLPLLLVLIALVGVYGILDFIVEFVIMLINFFSGRKCFPVFEEDEEAYRRKQEALNIAREKEQPQPAPQPNNIYVQQVYYNANPNQMGQQGIPFPGMNPQGIPQPNPGFQANQIPQPNPGFQANQIPQPNPGLQANQIPQPGANFAPFSAAQLPGQGNAISEAPLPDQIPMQQEANPVEAPLEQEESKYE